MANSGAGSYNQAYLTGCGSAQKRYTIMKPQIVLWDIGLLRTKSAALTGPLPNDYITSISNLCKSLGD